MEVRPHESDIEAIVLGTIIANRTKYNEVKDLLHSDLFYDDYHKKVYEIFKTIEDTGDDPDMPTIAMELKKQGETDIVRLASLQQVFHVYQHVLHLQDLSIRRKYLNMADWLVSKASHEDVNAISEHIKKELESLYRDDSNTISTIQEAVKEVYEGIEQNLSQQKVLTGTPTGFEKFDLRSGGLQKSDLIIIGGESSHGKTSLAMSMVDNAIEYDSRIAIYSLEMPKKLLAARLMAMRSGIPSSELLFTPLEDSKFQVLDQSISKLYNSHLYFDDRSTSNIDTIINSIRTMKVKYDIEGVVIDYLQILNVNMRDSNEEKQLATVARRLKNLAMELDIWVIALSQLNRDMHNPVPNMNRVRGSGQIFEAADVVMFVYQASKYDRPFPSPFEQYNSEGLAMVDVAKGRNIGTLKFLCRFEARLTKFSDVDLNTLSFYESKEEEAAF